MFIYHVLIFSYYYFYSCVVYHPQKFCDFDSSIKDNSPAKRVCSYFLCFPYQISCSWYYNWLHVWHCKGANAVHLWGQLIYCLWLPIWTSTKLYIGIHNSTELKLLLFRYMEMRKHLPTTASKCSILLTRKHLTYVNLASCALGFFFLVTLFLSDLKCVFFPSPESH